MQFLFLFYLFVLASSTQYNFTDATIQTTFNSTDKISNSSADTCLKLIVSDSHLFHLSTQGKYQRWATNDLNQAEQDLYLSNLTPILDFDANDALNQLVFLNFQPQSITKTYFYGMNQIQLQYQSQKNNFQLTLNSTPFQVFVNGTYIYQFYGSILLKRNISSQIASQLMFPDLPLAYSQMSVSYDYSVGVVWNIETSCLFFNLTSMTVLGTYTPASAPTFLSTGTISFSRDNKYAIIETDNFNPVVVLSLSNFTVINSIKVDDVIYSSLFFDVSKNRALVLAKNEIVIFELATNLSYSLPPINASIFGVDSSMNLFFCSNNTITRMSFDVENKSSAQAGDKTGGKASPTPVNTTNSTNSTSAINANDSSIFPNGATNANNTSEGKNASGGNTSNNAGNINGTSMTDRTNNSQNCTPSSASPQKSFYLPLDLKVVGSPGQKIMSMLNTSLTAITMVANYVVNVAISTPITVYFLGFLNFVSTSSLYVLLNFPMPEQAYSYLSVLYTQLGPGIFTMLNLNVSVNPISDERVNNPRALYFGITSDLISGNSNNFMLFGINLVLLLIIRLLFNLFLSNSSFIKQSFKRQMKFMIYGQIIGLLQQLLFPWASVLAHGGVTNIINKIALTLYIGTLFLCVIFPILYFFELTQKNNQSSCKLALSNTQNALQVRWNRYYSIKIQMPNTKIYAPPAKKTMHKLINNKMLEEWFLCQANLFFPLLVLLDSPVIFMMVILVHNIEGVILAFLNPRRRLNNILLASYPLLFHISFMIFYWCSQAYILAITQIVCLLSLLLGFVHNICLILFQTFSFGYKMIRFFNIKNQVAPKSQDANSEKKQQTCLQESKAEKLGNRTKTTGIGANKSEKLLLRKQKTNIQFVIKKHAEVNESINHEAAEQRKQKRDKYPHLESMQPKRHNAFMKKAKSNKSVDFLKIVTTKKILDEIK